MAKGDVAVTVTLPPDTDKLIRKLADKGKVTRRVIIIRAVQLLAEQAKAAK